MEAYNDQKAEQKHLLYLLGRLSSMAFVEKFPDERSVFPESFTQESEPDSELQEVIKKAEELGHPTGAF